MKKRIYMDYAASTPLDARVLDEMTGFYRNHWGNSAAVHSFGKFLQQRIDEARSDFAAELNADASGIIFTSSATESNNTVLFGLPQKDAGHIIISNIEHPSIEKAADILREKGWEITLIKADKTGYVNPADVRTSIKPQTALVSVQYVNNELGTIQPIEEIGQICKENSVLFHTDAAQGFGKLKIDVKKCHIDFLSFSSTQLSNSSILKSNQIKIFFNSIIFCLNCSISHPINFQRIYYIFFYAHRFNKFRILKYNSKFSSIFLDIIITKSSITAVSPSIATQEPK